MPSDKRSLYFLCPYPQGAAPSQRFRFEQYLKDFEDAGFEVHHHSFISNQGWEVLYQKGNFAKKGWIMLTSFYRRFLLICKLKKTDYVFVHRELAHFGPPIFEFILAKIKKVDYVYDFDDAIWLPNYSEANSSIQWIKAYWKVKYCIKWANKVVAGNDFLANYARQLNADVQVIPTTIDIAHHNFIETTDTDKLVIGWTGSHSTIHYLDQVLPVIEKLEAEFDFTFKVIADISPNFNLKSFQFVKWQKETEIEDLRTFSIGLMPLVEDKWSNGKCGFKALQYMSLKIPAIVSPVGVNEVIIQDKVNGLIASTPEEFYQAIRSLLENMQTRRAIGQKGYETLVEKYSTTANYQKYIRLFSTPQTKPY